VYHAVKLLENSSVLALSTYGPYDLPRFYQPVKTEDSAAVTAMFLEMNWYVLGLLSSRFGARRKPRRNFRKALASNVFTALTEIPNCFPISRYLMAAMRKKITSLLPFR